MRFSTVAAILGASAAAVAQSATETDTITNLSIRYDQGAIKNASFKLVEPNVECADVDGSQLAEDGVADCGETDYRFALTGTPEEGKFSLRVYKQTGLAAGITGVVDTQPYCHAGGNGAIQCTSMNDYSVTLKA